MLHFIHNYMCGYVRLTFYKIYGMNMVCVICVVNIKYSNISSQVHISIATLEIRPRSITIKGAIICNYFNTRLNIITYSLMNYKCTLKKVILNNDVNK